MIFCSAKSNLSTQKNAEELHKNNKNTTEPKFCGVYVSGDPYGNRTRYKDV